MAVSTQKFSWLVRAGYFSRAILYTVLGLIALTSIGQISGGTNGIFQTIENFPAGTLILWLMVVGLAAYALFRFASTFFDIEHEGSDKTGWAKRLGHAGSAIGHIALAYSAFMFATADGASGGGAQEAASGVLSMTLGGLFLGLLGAAFVVAGIFQAKKGFSGEFMNRISGAAPSGTRKLGAVGYSARAIVFVVIGWSLIRAGLFSAGSDQVETLGGAVASLSDNGAWFTIVSVGLLIFGLFSLILARYRIIPDFASDSRIPAFRA